MESEKRVFKVFVDFDGTITRQDIGEEMFLKFGDPKKAYEIIKVWMNDEISSTKMWELLCKTVKGFDQKVFAEFLESMELDPAFKLFLDYCKTNDIEVTVLSDGMDIYIDPVLKREGLDHLRVFTNKISIDENNNLIPSFPFTDEECKDCANCKRNHVITYSADDDYSIYIGDGLSDKCAAQFCDFIFAKSSLLKYCEKNRISYFPFRNFNDVIKRVDELVNKKRLKKRHQAFLKRKEVYSLG